MSSLGACELTHPGQSRLPAPPGTRIPHQVWACGTCPTEGGWSDSLEAPCPCSLLSQAFLQVMHIAENTRERPLGHGVGEGLLILLGGDRVVTFWTLA